MKVSFETLVSDKSGRNAAGDSFIDVINEKIKLTTTTRHTSQQEMEELLDAIEPYVVTVKFLNPKTNSTKTITAYISTPEPEYYTIQGNKVLYKPMSLNFIEL